MALFKQKYGVGGDKNLLVPALIASLVLMLIAVAFFYLDDRQKTVQVKYSNIFKRQHDLLLDMDKSATGLIVGQENADNQLVAAEKEFETLYNIFINGSQERSLPALPSTPAFDDVSNLWAGYKADVDTILGGRDLILKRTQDINSMSAVLPELLTKSDQIAHRMVLDGESNRVVYIASRQLFLIDQLDNKLKDYKQNKENVHKKFIATSKRYELVLNALLNGDTSAGVARIDNPATRKIISETKALYNSIKPQIKALSEPEEMAVFAKSVSSINKNTKRLFDAVSDLDKVSSSETFSKSIYLWIAGVLVVVALILAFGAVYMEQRQIGKRAKQVDEQNRKNQQAILRLLDEMTHLAEGDLTSYATVTEDITGAIADSMNYSIDALRGLVETINNTVVNVSSSSEQTQAITKRLQAASAKQSQEITSATKQINDMSSTMMSMSEKATQSADVALKSVDIANKGAVTVQKNIEGMDVVRENIQETSKRIKRLGESSQQIGEIVALITDIADQTNILALNAAIQASSAGEAGRGFAVVADEVQRLAERAGNATKQIATLVKTIQADTNEAVASMEQSTAGVVNGAKLAEDAGMSLVEIESVSQELAGLINGISSDATGQANSAREISQSMNVLQSITAETSESTNLTAKSVGQLSELANELRESVAGFKLPEASIAG